MQWRRLGLQTNTFLVARRSAGIQRNFRGDHGSRAHDLHRYRDLERRISHLLGAVAVQILADQPPRGNAFWAASILISWAE